MKLPVLLAAAALTICLTGCSHAQTDATPSATSETAEAAATATPAATPATSAEPVCAEVGTILPETADAGRSYVDETLFIGDSNTARYLLYANETGTAFTSLNNNIGVVSMGVGSITSLKCEKFKGSSAMYTVPDAVAMLKPKRIIICYGTNNLSGSSTDATNYIKTYLQGLQAIQTAWPYCDIIVSAIPPLDRQRENTNLTMTQVDAYNAALVQMCEENGFKFLNSAEVLRDDATGWAKKDYTLSDGVHLSKEAVTAYFTYVRTHAYAAEDRRPQPLGTIPTPDGVPANLINKDPIAVRGAKVPLEFVAANGGKLSGTTSQLVKKGGTAAAVTAVPDEGFVFAGDRVYYCNAGGLYSCNLDGGDQRKEMRFFYDYKNDYYYTHLIPLPNHQILCDTEIADGAGGTAQLLIYDTENSKSTKIGSLKMDGYCSFYTHGDDLYMSGYGYDGGRTDGTLFKYSLSTADMEVIDVDVFVKDFNGIFGDIAYFTDSERGGKINIYKLDLTKNEGFTSFSVYDDDESMHDILIYRDQVFITSGTGAGDGFAVWNGKEFDYKDPGISEHGLLSEYGGMEFLGSKLVGMTWNGIDNSDDKITQLYDLQ